MNQADEILLIVLAVVLVVFLLMLIWGLAYVLKVLKALKRITSDAEKLMDSAETVGEVFKNASGPIALIKVINNLHKVVTKQRRAK